MLSPHCPKVLWGRLLFCWVRFVADGSVSRMINLEFVARYAVLDPRRAVVSPGPSVVEDNVSDVPQLNWIEILTTYNPRLRPGFNMRRRRMRWCVSCSFPVVPSFSTGFSRRTDIDFSVYEGSQRRGAELLSSETKPQLTRSILFP
jgi:hypothetical protein